MMYVVGVLSATVMLGMVGVHKVSTYQERRRKQGWEGALHWERKAAASLPDVSRPTSVWLTVYARKDQEALRLHKEARLMLYGTVQKARAEGIPVKEIAALTHMPESTVRRIAPIRAQAQATESTE